MNRLVMIVFLVNVNKVVLLCNLCYFGIFSVLCVVMQCFEVGVYGIMVYLCLDECYICVDDVYVLVDLFKCWLQVEFNIEGNFFYNLMDFVCEVCLY